MQANTYIHTSKFIMYTCIIYICVQLYLIIYTYISIISYSKLRKNWAGPTKRYIEQMDARIPNHEGLPDGLVTISPSESWHGHTTYNKHEK